MAASPQFKAYNEAGEYIAAFKHADDAANFVCIFEFGGTVRVGHSAKLTIYRSPTMDERDAGADLPGFDELAEQMARAIEALGLRPDGTLDPYKSR